MAATKSIVGDSSEQPIPLPTHHSFRNLTGWVFGRLTVLEIAGTNGGTSWKCRCECGSIVSVLCTSLTSGNKKSCGCLNRDRLRSAPIRKTHGLSQTKEHGAWRHMIRRCTNAKDSSFHRYGGRGIKVCERWQSFENFYADMGDAPSEVHALDRIDNDGNYEPGNVRWVTFKVNNRNRRSNCTLTLNGETLCVAEWAERIGISDRTITKRILAGWSDELILTTPLQVRGSSPVKRQAISPESQENPPVRR